jgi:murein DD-endopeptidase MepM/ murein hydrolase activator NlpD
MSRIAVMADQRVKRGDVIGYVGSTGRSTAAHLHYEVWMNGRLTDPMTLLAQ